MTFRGPRLRDVLKASGAAGRRVTFQGLDGYESRFDVADLPGDQTILALEVDGKPLSIGGRGPLWLVFPAGTVAHQDPASDAGLAWAVFHIKVE